MRKLISLVLICCCLVACSTKTPEGITPVSEFELPRYLGKWYEIARLDHSFERGLSHVTAEYAMREGGGVSVVNQGHSAEEASWQSATGKAFFVEDSQTGHFKVSFFGPFYGAYVIFKLDDNYQYAFISGPNRKYLWFLSRTANVSDAQIERFVSTAKKLGFEVDNLIFVDQQGQP